MLVGLRWWSHIKEDGTEEWVFESMGENRNSNGVDSKVFWISCYVTPIVWAVFIVISILSLNFGNVSICLIGAMLASVNLLGYMRCEKNHKAHVSGFLLNQAKKNIS